MTPALEQLAAVVRREIGMSIRGAQLSSLEAALRRVDPSLDVATFLRTGTDSAATATLLDRLIDEVTVNETFFFRQRAQFEAIDWHGLRDAARAAGSDTVRVWVAACASGEEAYTLAMLASEAFGSAEPPVSILATDISTAALDRAACGRYRGRAVRAVDEDMRRRHFVNVGDDLVIGPRLRDLVEFRRHNLVHASGPPPGEAQFELIACRNVLIYFDDDTVERVIVALERALEPHGMLLLGAADQLCGSSRRLAGLEGSVAAVPPSPAPGPAPPPALRRPLRPDAEPSLDEAVQAANDGSLDAAVEIAVRLLGDDPLDADVHFVRGLAELGLGHADAAVSSLRRALYVDPAFGLAAFQLGRAHEEQGDAAAAARAYEHALRTLEPGDGRHQTILDQVDLGDAATACAIRLGALRDGRREGRR